MKVDVEMVGKTALKAAGVVCVGTGIVVAGAVVASCVAVGSIAGGFATAKDLFEETFSRRTYVAPKLDLEEN